MRWNKVAILGVGLLGGSLGHALKQRALAQRVTGFVRRRASLRECERLGAVDEATLNLSEAVRDADLIVLCTPLAQMRPLAEQMRPALQPGAIVTDVGSVKASVVRDLETLVARAGGRFVGSHPLAGAEKTGVAWARPDLFEGAVCVVTPTARTDAKALQQVGSLWRALGARVLSLSPQQHDALLARSSHLPHVLAAALASLVLDHRRPRTQSLVCANGFRDTTRIASGSPEMWRDIALANRAHLRRALAEFIRQLQRIQTLLASGDAAALERWFATAKARRDHWCAARAARSPE
ncbi:MAG: prephenate dehydrogenase/arogenate dehydrogenase family protein [Verrucomicrobiales bacterium]|nr:prephenate dehydrogenase/arogenate dehydrogenase family protein [Verrucomicrobiales bacterium]